MTTQAPMNVTRRVAMKAGLGTALSALSLSALRAYRREITALFCDLRGFTGYAPGAINPWHLHPYSVSQTTTSLPPELGNSVFKSAV